MARWIDSESPCRPDKVRSSSKENHARSDSAEKNGSRPRDDGNLRTTTASSSSSSRVSEISPRSPFSPKKRISRCPRSPTGVAKSPVPRRIASTPQKNSPKASTSSRRTLVISPRAASTHSKSPTASPVSFKIPLKVATTPSKASLAYRRAPNTSWAVGNISQTNPDTSWPEADISRPGDTKSWTEANTYSRPAATTPRKAPGDFRKTLNGFSKDRNNLSKEISVSSEKLSDSRKEPNGLKKEPSSFRQQPNGIRKELNGFRREPNGTRKDPFGFRREHQFSRKPRKSSPRAPSTSTGETSSSPKTPKRSYSASREEIARKFAPRSRHRQRPPQRENSSSQRRVQQSRSQQLGHEPLEVPQTRTPQFLVPHFEGSRSVQPQLTSRQPLMPKIGKSRMEFPSKPIWWYPFEPPVGSLQKLASVPKVHDEASYRALKRSHDLHYINWGHALVEGFAQEKLAYYDRR